MDLDNEIYAIKILANFTLISLVAQFIFELLYYPMDTWKTRLQYKSIYGMDNANGIRHIYRGFCISMLVSMAILLLFIHISFAIAIFFHVFRTGGEPNILLFVGSLFVLQLIACALLVPREVIKVRQQVNIAPVGCVTILRDAYRKDGFFDGVFRGFWISFVVMTIDFFQNFVSIRMLVASNLSTQFILVEIIGFLVVLAILPPLDLAKAAIQIHDTKATDIEKSDNANYQQLSAFSCVTDENKRSSLKILWSIYQKRGFRELYAGFRPILIRMTIVTVIATTLVYLS